MNPNTVQILQIQILLFNGFITEAGLNTAQDSSSGSIFELFAYLWMFLSLIQLIEFVFFFRVFKSVESTEAYIEVRDLTMSGYTFKIYSVNQENSSIDHAEVVLPPEKTRKQPLNHIFKSLFSLKYLKE